MTKGKSTTTITIPIKAFTKKPPSKDTMPFIMPPGGLESLNAKQRRLYKRAQERAAQETGPVATEVNADTSARMKRKRAVENPHIVFVGQLGFKTTAEALREHLEKGGVAGPVQVRLLTEKGTGKSRGQAFVTLIDAENQYKCLSLHHTKLDGRVINIERSCGGKNMDKRKEKITALRGEQKVALQATCDRILKEKIEAGELKPGELDDQAVGLLTRYDGAMASAILEAYCAEDRDRLRNSSAYFMMLAKRVIEEGIEAVLADTAMTKARRAAQAAGVPYVPGEKKDEREKGGAPAVKKTKRESEQPQQQREEPEEVTDEEEEEEERGWGMPHHNELGDAMDKTSNRSSSTGRVVVATAVGGRGQGRGDDYDITRVFGSARGRGGFGGAGRGGGGGRGRGYVGGRGRGGGGRGGGR
eukprot:evm.model.NODE_1278_length_22383_cov_20.731983.4